MKHSLKLIFFKISAMGAAYGTAKSGTGIAAMAVMRPEAIMKSIIPVVMAGMLIVGRVHLITILLSYLFDQVSSLSTEWLWQSSLLVSFPAQDTLYTSKCQQKYLQMTHHLCSGALFTWALASQSACQDSLLATLSGLWVTPECGARPSSPDSSWE